MTLIIGLNLSDRLYLAGDTRVTFKDGTTKDNALKILPFLDLQNFPEHSMGIAAAGNVDLANYLHKNISDAIKVGNLGCDVRILKQQLESFCDKLIVDWVNEGKPTNVQCCLLFAGTFAYRKKEINLGILKHLVEIYEEKSRKDQLKRHLTEKALLHDSSLQLLDKKLIESTGLGVIEQLDKSSKPSIPNYIQKAINTKNGYLDEQVDSLVFSISINVSNRKIIIHSAEWGDLLAFGTDGITKADIPMDILAMLELSGITGTNDHMLASVIISRTILDLAKEKKIQAIGGGVTVAIVKKADFQITGDGLKTGPGIFSIKINGIETPLTPFTLYNQLSKGLGASL